MNRRSAALRQHISRFTCIPRPLVASLLVAALLAPAMAQSRDSQAGASERVRQVLQPVRRQAITEIAAAARSEHPELRMNAIEAMQPIPERARPLAQLGLNDENKAVRFAALVTVGKLKLGSLAPAAKQLIDDPAPSVRAAALFAAHQCGLKVNISPLAKLAGSREPTVRGNAVMLLGMMGEPSAKRMLREVAEAPMPRAHSAREAIVEVQIAEALVKLGDEKQLQPLRAKMYSAYLEARILAVTVLGELGDQKMVAAMQQLTENPPIELQLAAAKALARMGYEGGLDILLEGASMQPGEISKRAETFLGKKKRADVSDRFKQLVSDKSLQRTVAANIRVQAAFGLGFVDDPAAAKELRRLLKDGDPRVRLAAAAAIIQALGPADARATADRQPENKASRGS